MTDKPKRKRSESVKPLYNKRLHGLLVMYILSLTPYLIDMCIICALLAIVLGLSSLWIGSNLVILFGVGQPKENLLTPCAVAFITIPFTVLAWVLFTATTVIGLYSVVIGLFPLNIAYIVGIAIVSIITMVLTNELQIFIIDFINTFPSYAIGKQKNVDVESVEYESEAEPEIPLELLAESESIERARR
jgi:hypothetical protein